MLESVVCATGALGLLHRSELELALCTAHTLPPKEPEARLHAGVSKHLAYGHGIALARIRVSSHAGRPDLPSRYPISPGRSLSSAGTPPPCVPSCRFRWRR